MGLSVAAGVGRATPPGLGLRVALRTADLLAARRESAAVRAIRGNQWVVSGSSCDEAGLDAAVRETMRNIARYTYDFYHLGSDPDRLVSEVAVSDGVLQWIERVREGEAVVFAAVHLSNFDLGGLALARRGLRAQVLSVPDPTDAYRAQNDLRRRAGLDITPISAQALKTARRRLEGGGAVLTGIDRPVPGSSRAFAFFGRPAHLPDVHVRLAGRTSAPLVLLWAVMGPDGRYAVECDRIALGPAGGVQTDRHNAEAVLARAEREIALRPTQWAMPHPVWPDALRDLDELERKVDASDG